MALAWSSHCRKTAVTASCECATIKLLSFLQKAMHLVVGGRLTGCRELWKVSTEPLLVEAVQVVLASLNEFEDFMALHVVQWCAQRIKTLHFPARFHMVTSHLVPLIPLLEALTDLLVPPHAKVYIHAMSKTVVVGSMFFLRVFAVKLWQQNGL